MLELFSNVCLIIALVRYEGKIEVYLVMEAYLRICWSLEKNLIRLRTLVLINIDVGKVKPCIIINGISWGVGCGVN